MSWAGGLYNPEDGGAYALRVGHVFLDLRSRLGRKGFYDFDGGCGPGACFFVWRVFGCIASYVGIAGLFVRAFACLMRGRVFVALRVFTWLARVD